jgi:hypothetical protein
MEISDLIEQIEGWQSKTTDEVWDELNAPTKLFVDPEWWSLLGIAQVIGDANVKPLINYLSAVGLDWIAIQAAGRGVPIGDPGVNAKLRTLGVDDAIKIADAGRRQISILEMFCAITTKDEVGYVLELMKLNIKKSMIDDTWKDRLQAAREKLTVWNGDPATEPKL